MKTKALVLALIVTATLALLGVASSHVGIQIGGGPSPSMEKVVEMIVRLAESKQSEQVKMAAFGAIEAVARASRSDGNTISGASIKMGESSLEQSGAAIKIN